MPYHVAKTDACPASKPWGVMKEGETKPMGCHASEEEAMAQMAALMANEPSMKAEWSSAYVTSLPDSAFACVDSSGRHYPHHDKSGAVDLPHLRAALSRIGDASNTQCGKGHLQAHARSAGVGKAEFLKAEQIDGAKWRVLAIPFGGPFNGRDLDGEFFTQRTDIKADWFDRRPLVWHHNLDRTMKGDPVVGSQEDLEEPTKEGWWTTLWLNRSHQYWAEVDKLLRAGKVYGSSGSLPNFVRTDAKTGEILVWPYIEQTLTPTPSNPYSVVVAAKAVDHFDEAGIGLSPAVRGLLSDLEGHTADLPADLASAGDAAARRERLSGELTALLERIKNI